MDVSKDITLARILQILLTNVRSNLQDDYLFKVIINTALYRGLVTEKELADKILSPSIGELARIHTIQEWREGKSLPHPSHRTTFFNWIKEELDNQLKPKNRAKKSKRRQ